MGGDTYWQNYKWESTEPSNEPDDHHSLYLIVYRDSQKIIDEYFGLKNYPNQAVKLLKFSDFKTQSGLSGRQYTTESLDHPVGVKTVTTILN